MYERGKYIETYPVGAYSLPWSQSSPFPSRPFSLYNKSPVFHAVAKKEGRTPNTQYQRLFTTPFLLSLFLGWLHHV
jgi:hypothetical protein